MGERPPDTQAPTVAEEEVVVSVDAIIRLPMVVSLREQNRPPAYSPCLATKIPASPEVEGLIFQTEVLPITLLAAAEAASFTSGGNFHFGVCFTAD
jgi:hypothetical protein